MAGVLILQKNLKKKKYIYVETGGVKLNLKKFSSPNIAIVAVNGSEQVSVTEELIKAGVSRILIENQGHLILRT